MSIKKKITLTILTLIIVRNSLFSQIKELYQLKQIPFVEKESMKIITTSICTLYQNAIKNPETSKVFVGQQYQ
ncbi:MAG: hypothetical protein JST94_00845 [Bacteroidetes bacterium]|nr:hypothetical protein [Bacteroidota bacterium]MBS1670001.1 hypothetical protein [Bacteroidota bacterium]